MKSQLEILERLRKVVTDIIEIESSAIVPKANIREDLRADSLASAEIVMALEDEFKIEFSEEKVSTLVTVADLISAIMTELSKRTDSIK